MLLRKPVQVQTRSVVLPQGTLSYLVSTVSSASEAGAHSVACLPQVFDEHMPGSNQLSKLRQDVEVTADDLLRVPEVCVAPSLGRCCSNPSADCIASANAVVTHYHLLRCKYGRRKSFARLCPTGCQAVAQPLSVTRLDCHLLWSCQAKHLSVLARRPAAVYISQMSLSLSLSLSRPPLRDTAQGFDPRLVPVPEPSADPAPDPTRDTANPTLTETLG
jgi:hypothetical protein